LHGGFLPSILYCIIKKCGYLKNNGTFFWNFIVNSGFQSFAVDLIQPLAARNNKRFFVRLLWQIDSAETKLVDG